MKKLILFVIFLNNLLMTTASLAQSVKRDQEILKVCPGFFRFFQGDTMPPRVSVDKIFFNS
jgi:hypothetical protein